MTDRRNEIGDAGNDVDLALHEAQTLVRLLYEQTMELIEGEKITRNQMNAMSVLIGCLEHKVEIADAASGRLWKAALGLPPREGQE